MDVTGYKPEDLSVKVVGRKLYIDGKQEFRDGNIQMIEKETFIWSLFFILGEDYSVKEMRKVYDIPENASFEHMTSFLTTKGFYSFFVYLNIQ